jgi:hypothetical protein
MIFSSLAALGDAPRKLKLKSAGRDLPGQNMIK